MAETEGRGTEAEVEGDLLERGKKEDESMSRKWVRGRRPKG